MSKKPTAADAQLVLQLYDLRREAEIRKARNWWGGDFFPQSADDVMKIAFTMGSQENNWFRQVAGYWNMAASFVLMGVLNEELFLQPSISGEMFLIFAKVQPYLKEVRQKIGRSQLLSQYRESRNPHQVGQGSPAIHAEARRNHARAAQSQLLEAASSVILVGCADDLVVPDTGCQYARRGVRGHRFVYAFAEEPAQGPCRRGPGRRSGNRAPGRYHRALR